MAAETRNRIAAPGEGKRLAGTGLPPVALREWKAVIAATFYSAGENHLSLLAAGAAFYMLFALVPALGAAAWLAGFLFDPAVLRDETSYLRGVLPQEALDLVAGQFAGLNSAPASVTAAGLLNLAIALFTARTAAASMMEALNIIHRVPETRGLIKINAIAILFTLVAIVTMVLAVTVILAVPNVFKAAGLTYPGGLAAYLRWVVLAALAAGALAAVYRYGPDCKDACWHWLTWGSLAATLIWLAASAGFSWYVAAFNSYNRVYGSLGAAVILLFWFWLTAYAGLLGAQLDREAALLRRRLDDGSRQTGKN
jgi:membrane protein